MLDSIYHMTSRLLLKSHFCRKNVIILSLCSQRCYGRVNLQTTSGLTILLHGVISLPDATSCDKIYFCPWGLFLPLIANSVYPDEMLYATIINIIIIHIFP